MFKKTKIAAVSAAVLGLTSMSAQAVSVAGTGADSGQALIFPYYNANPGYISAFNITNTSGDTKAVRVRFRESKYSSDVLDFNLYMSPYDVFTMTVASNGTNVIVRTNDNTCTYPEIPDEGIGFRWSLPVTIQPVASALVGLELGDVSEGYLEVIEMGVVDNDFIEHGVRHDADGMPFDCSVIDLAWKDGDFNQGGARSNGSDTDIENNEPGDIHTVRPNPIGFRNQSRDSEEGYYGDAHVKYIDRPTGGLVGSSIFVNTTDISAYVAEPTAIVNYSTRAQHYLSGDDNLHLLPSLASGSVTSTEYMSNELFPVDKYNDHGEGGQHNVRPFVYHQWDLVARDWGMDDPNGYNGPLQVTDPTLPGVDRLWNPPSGINPMPVADALLVSTLSNQYFAADDAKTDWVVTAPMRKHAVYNDWMYAPSSTALNGFWQLLPTYDLVANYGFYNREENDNAVVDFSPPIIQPNVYLFEDEVSVITISRNAAEKPQTNEIPGAPSLLGSSKAKGIIIHDEAEQFKNGWAWFEFDRSFDIAGNGIIYDLAGPRYARWIGSASRVHEAKGVPLIGFMAANVADAGLGSLGETFPHNTMRIADTDYSFGPTPK